MPILFHLFVFMSHNCLRLSFLDSDYYNPDTGVSEWERPQCDPEVLSVLLVRSLLLFDLSVSHFFSSALFVSRGILPLHPDHRLP